MARARVVHSEDACTIVFEGDRRNPEPSSGIIKFPGGHVEVTRTSDGGYWAHIGLDSPADDSRVDYSFEGRANGILNVPDFQHVAHIAIHVPAKPTPEKT